MIKNYFFDFDKTLTDTGDVSVIAIQDAFRVFNLTPPIKETILDFMGIPAEVSIPKMASEKLIDEQVTAICEEFRSIYSLLEFDKTKLYPEVSKLLEKLYRKDKKLFIVSSKESCALNRSLENLGILLFFTDVIGCDMVTHFKPDPEGIEALINKHHLERDESVMIGDARYDLQMGKNANVKTCGAKWGAFDVQSLIKEKPDYLAEHPMDILNFS